MQLTRNFSLAEIWAHNSTPNEVQVRTCAMLACTILQPLRDYIGMPIKITSGYRPMAVSGGSATSEHFYNGNDGAVDINIGSKPNPADNHKAFVWLMGNTFYGIGQLIWYTETTHLHISLAGRNQSEVLCCVSKAEHTYRPVRYVSDLARYDKRIR